MPASNPTTDVEPEALPIEAAPVHLDPPAGMLDLSQSHPIIEVVYRHRAQVGGKVRSVRVRPWGEVLTFEVVLADMTGAITVAFGGRRSVAAVKLGSWLTVEGMVGQRDGKLIILNPAYDLRALGPDPA